MNLICWWLGCERHPEDHTPPDYVMCRRCGENVSYSDLVGDTRCYRFKHALVSLWRWAWPLKCVDCGRRWRECDVNEEHSIPF